MKIEQPYLCDVCRAPKRQANHWYMRRLDCPEFVMYVWSDAAADSMCDHGKPLFEHICGNVCCGKALEAWLGKQGKAL